MKAETGLAEIAIKEEKSKVPRTFGVRPSLSQDKIDGAVLPARDFMMVAAARLDVPFEMFRNPRVISKWMYLIREVLLGQEGASSQEVSNSVAYAVLSTIFNFHQAIISYKADLAAANINSPSSPAVEHRSITNILRDLLADMIDDCMKYLRPRDLTHFIVGLITQSFPGKDSYVAKTQWPLKPYSSLELPDNETLTHFLLNHAVLHRLNCSEPFLSDAINMLLNRAQRYVNNKRSNADHENKTENLDQAVILAHHAAKLLCFKSTSMDAAYLPIMLPDDLSVTFDQSNELLDKKEIEGMKKIYDKRRSDVGLSGSLSVTLDKYAVLFETYHSIMMMLRAIRKRRQNVQNQKREPLLNSPFIEGKLKMLRETKNFLLHQGEYGMPSIRNTRGRFLGHHNEVNKIINFWTNELYQDGNANEASIGLIEATTFYLDRVEGLSVVLTENELEKIQANNPSGASAQDAVCVALRRTLVEKIIDVVHNSLPKNKSDLSDDDWLNIAWTAYGRVFLRIKNYLSAEERASLAHLAEALWHRVRDGKMPAPVLDMLRDLAAFAGNEAKIAIQSIIFMTKYHLDFLRKPLVTSGTLDEKKYAIALGKIEDLTKVLIGGKLLPRDGFGTSHPNYSALMEAYVQIVSDFVDVFVEFIPYQARPNIATPSTDPRLAMFLGVFSQLFAEKTLTGHMNTYFSKKYGQGVTVQTRFVNRVKKAIEQAGNIREKIWTE